jgi:hypothetical protein
MKSLVVFLVLITMNVISYGQLTPQRINYNGQAGIFFTTKQEETLLKAMVNLDACKKSEFLLNQNVNSYEIRLKDKDLAIKTLTDAYVKCQDSNKINLEKIGALQLNVDNLNSELSTTQGELTTYKISTGVFVVTTAVFLTTTVIALVK